MKCNAEFFGQVGGPDKGETWPSSHVCKVMKVDAKDMDASALAKLAFAQGYEKYLRDTGYSANVKVTREGVRWLTDAEAVHHNMKRRRAGVRKIHRAKRGLDNVVVSELESTERETHERETRLTAMQSMALTRAAREKPEFEPVAPAQRVPLIPRKRNGE
jgi:hypothetical protein